MLEALGIAVAGGTAGGIAGRVLKEVVGEEALAEVVDLVL